MQLVQREQLANLQALSGAGSSKSSPSSSAFNVNYNKTDNGFTLVITGNRS
ncbi:MAG TPA: hypothetical protein VJS30_10670 [Paraburkholderia sp.]|nr:hypothetical protein [Paraburkholderia sp.]